MMQQEHGNDAALRTRAAMALGFQVRGPQGHGGKLSDDVAIDSSTAYVSRKFLFVKNDGTALSIPVYDSASWGVRES